TSRQRAGTSPRISCPDLFGTQEMHMNRSWIPLSLTAATLAACVGGYETVTPASGYISAPVAPAPPIAVAPPPAYYPPVTPQVAPPVLRPGIGRVDSITPLADASGVPLEQRRVGLRMDDGAPQFVDTRADNLAVGDRV